MFPVYGVEDAPPGARASARTMSGTALAISATRIDPELRRGSASVWPLRLPPTGWLPAAPHESSAPAKGIRNKDAGGTPALPGDPFGRPVQIRILQKARSINRRGVPCGRPLFGADRANANNGQPQGLPLRWGGAAWDSPDTGTLPFLLGRRYDCRRTLRSRPPESTGGPRDAR